MIVDMCCFASDHPDSAIVIITGDVDFSYVIAILRSRRHKIYCITPVMANDTLHNVPDHTWNWLGFSGMGIRCSKCSIQLIGPEHMLLDGIDPPNITTMVGDKFKRLLIGNCCIVTSHSTSCSLIVAPDNYYPDPNNTFFEGYAWQNVNCLCGNHVGWYYTAVNENTYPFNFWAIQTKLF
jgi:hypothetical protein